MCVCVDAKRPDGALGRSHFFEMALLIPLFFRADVTRCLFLIVRIWDEQVMIGEDTLIRFSGCKAGEACTIVLRGAR